MIKALIFDVDGTLAETEELHRASFNKVFAQFGFDWHWDEETYGKLLTTTGGKERIIRHVSELGLPPLDVAVVQKMHHAKNVLYAEAVATGGLVLRPGVEQTIRGAKSRGLRLGIATTTSRSNVTALTAACFPFEGQQLFDTIICGEDVSRKKPDPEVYTLCLERMQIAPDEALAFEDSAVGLSAAASAGIATIVTPSRYTEKDTFQGALAVLADLTVDLDRLILIKR
jgi:HAD superfamily hydrolase (TIGR01509 family)